MRTQQITFQKYTSLPIKEIVKSDSIGTAIHIHAPQGDSIVEYKEIHYPFLFGSTTSLDTPAGKIIRKLYEIEDEAKDYLLKQWLSDQKV